MAKAKPYNPNAYVPGGSSPAVSAAIQAKGYAEPGPNPVYVPQDAPSPDQGASDGGDSNPGVTVGTDNTDWSATLGYYGLPSDLVNQINSIYRSSLNADGTINYQEAYDRAHAYILGTAWYTQTYPGIQKGINAGLFSDEQGYRQYQNQVNQYFQQYYQRDATPSEISSYITTGKSVSQVANQFQSAAIQGNISDPLKALFSPDELKALANQQAGIDSALGQKAVAEANLFTQIAPLYQNFFGRTPTKTEIDQLTAAGTSPQTVAQQFATQENINGMNPAVSHLFTPDEIQQVALDAAGGITPNGASLKALMDLSLQLNPLYHQYTGNGVSRDEVNAAYANGTSPQTVGQQFAGAAFVNANKQDIQQTAGAFGDTGQLSAADLKALGEENAGLDTPQGQAVTAAYQKALARLHGVFKGVLANPSLSLSSGRLAGPGASKPPDVAA